MLIRLLLILATLVLIAWGILWFLRRSLQKWLRNLQPPSTMTQSPTDQLGEKLVACAYCHTYIPRNRAIFAKEHFFCCEDHASLSQ